MSQTCQPLIKENLETHEKKSGDSIKNSEILFFYRSRLNKPNQCLYDCDRFPALNLQRLLGNSIWETPLRRRLGIRRRSQGLLPFQNGGQARRKTIKFIEHKRKSQLGTKKKEQCSSLLVFHFMAQAFHVNFPFLFWFNDLNHFRMIFPKTREIEEPCRETVRNDKKSWDSRQNRESWQVWCLINLSCPAGRYYRRK